MKKLYKNKVDVLFLFIFALNIKLGKVRFLFN